MNKKDQRMKNWKVKLVAMLLILSSVIIFSVNTASADSCEEYTCQLTPSGFQHISADSKHCVNDTDSRKACESNKTSTFERSICTANDPKQLVSICNQLVRSESCDKKRKFNGDELVNEYKGEVTGTVGYDYNVDCTSTNKVVIVTHKEGNPRTENTWPILTMYP